MLRFVGATVFVIAMFGACRDQQPTPVAPSPTVPSPSPLSLNATRFTVTEHASESWNFAATSGYDTYVWDFGDDTEEETTHVWATIHSYTVVRSYSVMVTATATNGTTAQSTRDVQVTLVN